MPAKKKKFIDKKKAVTFHLVHRSQKDPLQADEDAPQHVLLEVADNEKTDARKEEQEKFGIFFDDEYDYLQHLKDANEINEVGPGTEVYRVERKEKSKQEPVIQLSSQLFGSELETDVGLLNKAAPLRGPQLDWDPDIVAALDEDFDFENPQNQLDDDFMTKANADEVPEELEASEEPVPRFHPAFMQDNILRPPVEKLDGSDEESGGEEDFASDEAEDDFSDDDGNFSAPSFDEEETKSRFTAYSMTSSVIRRNEGLTLLDDRFEKLYEQYDDDEIGALDQDDIGGCLSSKSKVLTALMEEFEEDTKEVKLKDAIEKGVNVAIGSESESEDGDDDLVKMTVEPVKEQWDCESILSTYSTLYNHPTTISEPRKVRPHKTSCEDPQILDSPAGRGLSLKDVQDLNREDAIVASTIRPKDESAEAKKARKQAVKQERKQRREDKKQNKTAFKVEEIRQHKEQLNIQNNLQGMKIS